MLSGWYLRATTTLSWAVEFNRRSPSNHFASVNCLDKHSGVPADEGGAWRFLTGAPGHVIGLHFEGVIILCYTQCEFSEIHFHHAIKLSLKFEMPLLRMVRLAVRV